MAITLSAKKEQRKNVKRRAINAVYKNNMNISMKIFLKKIKKGEKVDDKEIADVFSKIDKAQKKNIIHKKNAARKKSLIMRNYNLVSKKAVEKSIKSAKEE